jgi:hypothetical protein
MEREKVKLILAFCRDIDGEIKLNMRMLQDFEDKYYTSGGGGLDGMPRTKHRTSDPTPAVALNVPDSASAVMRDLRADIERLAALNAAILSELNKLPLPQKSIIYDFYITGLQWVQISGRAHYSATQCKKIRNRGLDNLAKHFVKNDMIKNFNYPS